MTNTSKFIGSEQIAEGTMAFHFEKPAGFEFKAGQNIDMTLIDPPETDEEGNMRTFSIASAPSEDRLTVATRMRDTAFKRVLKSMAPGTEVRMEGPLGDVTLQKNTERPAVFLAGGIGITLFRSIIKDAIENQLPHKLFLFYSNRRPEDAAFLDELQSLDNPNFTLVATMTDMEHSAQQWSGEQGYVNKEMLQKHLSDLAAPIYYIAGPPGMVVSLKEMLIAAGADEDSIRIEEFAGY